MHPSYNCLKLSHYLYQVLFLTFVAFRQSRTQNKYKYLPLLTMPLNYFQVFGSLAVMEDDDLKQMQGVIQRAHTVAEVHIWN